MRNPYVTGSYVTGSLYYGRQSLIDYLLDGASRAYWVIGNRRIGKTSLLRELERRALTADRLVPLFWDLQGAEDIGRLAKYLVDAVSDYSDRFEAIGITPATLPETDLIGALTALRRAAIGMGRQLLLLCDETEVLIDIAREQPEAIQRLHRELTASRGLRVVMTSTRGIYQMHDVCRDWPTSPFLAGFDMSQHLGSLRSKAAHDLIVQTQGEIRVEAAPEVIEAICESTNNHPYLVQHLCSDLFEEQGRLRVLDQKDLPVNPLLDGFFDTDFRNLTEADRQVVRAVYDAGVIDMEGVAKCCDQRPTELRQRVHNLVGLGYLRRVYGQLTIGNQFLAQWLSTVDADLHGIPMAPTSEDAMRVALAGQEAQEASFLVSRLNAHRDRLVELEATRSRDLLDVDLRVLDEIEQLQTEITQLRRLIVEVQPAAGPMQGVRDR